MRNSDINNTSRHYNTFPSHQQNNIIQSRGASLEEQQSQQQQLQHQRQSDSDEMRPAVPAVSWASSFTSWGIMTYIMLYVFLPHRLPQFEISVRVGEESPAPATMGTWVAAVANPTTAAEGMKWFLDEARKEIVSCGPPTTSKKKHSSGKNNKQQQDDDAEKSGNQSTNSLLLSSSSSTAAAPSALCEQLIGDAFQRLLSLVARDEGIYLFPSADDPSHPHHSSPLSPPPKTSSGSVAATTTTTAGPPDDDGKAKTSQYQFLSGLSLQEFFALWTFQPRQRDTSAGPVNDDITTSPSSSTRSPSSPPIVLAENGFLNVFGKATYAVKAPQQNGVPTPFASELLVDFRVMLREGTLVTSPMTYMRLIGGRKITDDNSTNNKILPHHASSAYQFSVIGTAPPTLGKVGISSLTGANRNSTLEEMVAEFQKNDAANTTVVLDIFSAAVMHQSRVQLEKAFQAAASIGNKPTAKAHKDEKRKKEDDSTATPTQASLIAALPLSAVAKEPMTSSNCLWFGNVRTSNVPFDHNHHRSNNDDILHRGIVEGDMFSTCGDHIRWITSEKQYESFVASWNLILFLLGVIPSAFLTVGLAKQLSYIKNSRARTLRLSRAALVVLVVYLLIVVCYVEILWSVMPTNVRMTNLVYTILFIDVMLALVLYSQVDSEQRRVDGRDGRAPLLMIYFGCSALGNLLPLVARTSLFSGPVLCIAGALLWIPQLTHLIQGKGRDGVVPWLLISASLLPMSFFSLFLLGPVLDVNSMSTHPSPLLVLCAVLEVAVFALALHIGSKIGIGRLFPRWMLPWVHDYNIPRHHVAQIAGLVEDPDCSICGESFEHPDDADSVTATDQVWVTPCKHLYHKSCLSQWMEQRMDCPLCRKVLPEP